MVENISKEDYQKLVELMKGHEVLRKQIDQICEECRRILQLGDDVMANDFIVELLNVDITKDGWEKKFKETLRTQIKNYQQKGE